GWDPERFGRLPRLERLTLWCCVAALRDAGWWERRGELRLGLGLGTGGGWFILWEEGALAGGRGVYTPRQGTDSLAGRTRRRERLTVWCCVAALRDAGWWERRGELRLGLVLGTGAEWFILWEEDALAGGRRVYTPRQDTDSLAARTCRRLQLSGPAASVSAACASGNYALAQARRWLELGWVDVCLAGA